MLIHALTALLGPCSVHLQRYWDLLALICRPDLCVRMLNEDMSAPPTATPPAGGRPPASQAKWPQAALAAAALPAAQRASLAGAWRQHCEAAAQRAQQRQELLAQIREGFLQVCDFTEQLQQLHSRPARAAKQLCSCMAGQATPQAGPCTCAPAPPASSSLPRRSHALSWPACPAMQPLQVAKPEEMELGKPLARRGLEVRTPPHTPVWLWAAVGQQCCPQPGVDGLNAWLRGAWGCTYLQHTSGMDGARHPNSVLLPLLQQA